jgi:D-tyrosyl-tRNA(Tyr) deacylase
LRAVVQRVAWARVTVDGEIVAEIEHGLCVLLSVGPTDDDRIADRLASRVATLRIFSDADGRMNLDVHSAAGSVLAVSQFTLHADTSRGHRPSFIRAAQPGLASRLYDRFVQALRTHALRVETGRFGASMQVELANDGPVTLVLSSGEGPWEADAG